MQLRRAASPSRSRLLSLGLVLGTATLSALTLGACAAPQGDADADAENAAAADLGEGEDSAASAIVPLTEPDETAPAGALAPAPLDKDEADDFIDVRGLGDAGWSRTHASTPIAPTFGAALDRFDATGIGYRGDLSFINWETVVGTACTTFAKPYEAGRSYAFVSHPDNLAQANDRGFNLVGLSNNHTRDCYGSPDTTLTGEAASADMTARAFASLGSRSWLVSGVASVTDRRDAPVARVGTFRIKGREVRVAFGSLYTGRPTCPQAACRADVRALFTSLKDAQADLRILAMHSVGAADQDELVKLGVSFVKEYGGDVVFGHGPHVWKPVRVVRKNGGGKGVVFESLGNGLHPGLAVQARNFIGRALFDVKEMKLRQVQVLPVKNAGTELSWSPADASVLPANLAWSPAERGVYANVRP